MKWLLGLLFVFTFIIPEAKAKTVIIDIISNYSYFDITQGVIPNHIIKLPKNDRMLTQYKKEDNIYFISEFSGIGVISKVEQIQVSSWLNLDYPFLKANETFGVKIDDFLFSLDTAFLNFFTTHPWEKFNKISGLLATLPQGEEVIIHTTSWKTGLSLYQGAVARYPKLKVSYVVRDLSLKNTILNNIDTVTSNISFIIYDNVPECVESFNVLNQLLYENSNYQFIKTNKFTEKTKNLIEATKRQLGLYRKKIGCN